MSETLIARKGPDLHKIATHICIGGVVSGIIALLVWLLFFMPQTFTSGGFSRFDGAVEARGVAVTNGAFSKAEYFVEFTLFRSGRYRVYPADTYTGELKVRHSIGPVQYFTLTSGEDTTTQRIKVGWQWEPGSQAQKHNWQPESVEFVLRRQRDGMIENSFQWLPTPK